MNRPGGFFPGFHCIDHGFVTLNNIASSKDLRVAGLVMLRFDGVTLRFQCGKSSKFGSVKVSKYHQILKFSHVMHIGSTVTGEIRDDKTALDAVDTVLPAGTLSGAPKIRAMQIINELENNKRGIYGGAVGYIDLTGNLDTCIAIRLAYKKHSKVYVRSGAGIVADSVAVKEHNECINKAKAVMTALNASGEEE